MLTQIMLKKINTQLIHYFGFEEWIHNIPKSLNASPAILENSQLKYIYKMLKVAHLVFSCSAST